jgi:hypothetical protein
VSEIIDLKPENFDYIYMHRLDAMVKRAPDLLQRRGVNPGLDALAVNAMGYAYSLKKAIETETVSAAIVSNPVTATVEGLLLATPDVAVKDTLTGKLVMNGVCLEAVCAKDSTLSVGDLYVEARELALRKYPENSSGLLFALEKVLKENKKGYLASIFRDGKNDSSKIKHAIGSALPETTNPGRFHRTDKKRPTKSLTEIMWLRTK